jgi:hypothetical protein
VSIECVLTDPRESPRLDTVRDLWDVPLAVRQTMLNEQFFDDTSLPMSAACAHDLEMVAGG